MTSILLVEDDELIGTGLKEILEMNQYEVFLAENCHLAEDLIREKDYQLAILDVRLPDGNGIELCRRLRTYSSCPVLFLSGYEDESYVVRGLEAGGDDYVIKPFRTMELLARIQALLRRNTKQQEAIGYVSGDLVLNLSSMRLTIADNPVDLPPIEFRVLLKLMGSQGTTVTTGQLVESVWNITGNYADDSSVRVWITRLRKHLEQEGAANVIETVRGMGYRWRWKVKPLFRS